MSDDEVDAGYIARALGDPSRRLILKVLSTGKSSVNDLVSVTHLKQPNVSNHLARMRRLGIVFGTRSGRSVSYDLAPAYQQVLHELLGATEGTGALARLTVKQPARLQPAQLRSVLARASDSELLSVARQLVASGMSLEDIYVVVLLPVLEEIGRDWASGKIQVLDEHAASGRAERLMAHLASLSHRGTPTGQRALVACVEGNLHQIGARMIADILAQNGWDVVFAGADVPSADVLRAVAVESYDLVALSCSAESQWEAARHLLECLERESMAHRPILAIGGAFVNLNVQRLGIAERFVVAQNARDFNVTVTTLLNTEKAAAKK